MIAQWMVYALLVSVVSGAAAVALERSLSHAGRSTRFVWAASIGLSLVVPVVGLLRFTPELVTSDAGGGVQPVIAAGTPGAVARVTGADAMTRLDLPLGVFWGAASILILAVLIRSQWRLIRAARLAPERAIAGIPVRRTPAIGPAVVGCFPSVIVVPEWIDHLDEEWRRLVILHELEHLESGDARLLYVCTVAVILQPWNLALWWQIRRLRDAVELDCDRRVLAGGIDARTYGKLLLTVAEHGRGDGIPAAAFSRPATLLSRRIETMFSAHRASRAQVVTFGIASALLVAVACEAPSPVGLPEAPESSLTDAAATTDTTLHYFGVARLTGEASRNDRTRAISEPQLEGLQRKIAGTLHLELPHVADTVIGRVSRRLAEETRGALWHYREPADSLDGDTPKLTPQESPSGSRFDFRRDDASPADNAEPIEPADAPAPVRLPEGTSRRAPQLSPGVVVYIDGVRVPRSALDIPHEGIESIEVVKGSAAPTGTAIYVTTKSAANGR